jgi:hypothetical protein
MTKFLAIFGLTTQDLKYALRSFIFSFLGLFIPGALGWLNDWTQWAPGRPYPDFAPLAAAAVAAVAGASVATVTLIVRGIEGKTGKAALRPNPPKV